MPHCGPTKLLLIRDKVAITYADPVCIVVGINHYAVEHII